MYREIVQEAVVAKALKAKFTQHENLKQLLLGTETRTLVFEAQNDEYWGSGAERKGLNRLGKNLETLRTSLKKV